MNLNIQKHLNIPEPTQRNKFKVIKPEPTYTGKSPGLFTIEEIIGRSAGRHTATTKRPAHHNPGIALHFTTECIVSPYYHSGHH